MKRRSKKLLLSFVVALLVLAGLGWSVAEGHWPAVNRWAEKKLLVALRDAGFSPSAVPLRQLSWKHAEAGPVALELPGVTFQIEHASAELGFAVWRKQGALDFTVRGARVVVDLARLEELRAWQAARKQAPGGDPRDLTFDIADSVLELRHGELRRELAFAGRARWIDHQLSLEAKLSAPELRVEVALAADGKLTVGKGVANPGAWRELLVAVAPEALGAWRPLDVDQLEFSGSAQIAVAGIDPLDLTLRGRKVSWTDAGRELRASQVDTRIQRAHGTWSWDSIVAFEPNGQWGEWNLRGRRAVLEKRGAAKALKLEGASLSGAGFRAQGEVELDATWTTDTWPATAHLRWRQALGGKDGFSWSGETVSADWDGRVLQLNVPGAELLTPHRARLNDLKLTVREPRSELPVAEGTVQLSAETAALSGAAGWEISPATLDVPVSFQASLARGQESVRATAKLPAAERRVRWAENEMQANAALTLTTTFDREFVSGRLAVEGGDWKLRAGERRITAGKGEFSLRWPRVWWSAVRNWSRLPRERVVREALWAGDVDWNLSDATIAASTLGDWRGANLRARIRGGEFSGESGIDFGLSADEGDVAGQRIRDVQVQGAAGFDSARVEFAGNPALLPVRLTGVQSITWAENLAARGELSVPEFDLAAAKGLADRLPSLGRVQHAGFLSGTATTQWRAAGTLELNAAVKLRDGVIANDELGARCEGVQAELKFASLAPLATDGLQKVTFERAKLSGVEITQGTVDLALLPTGRIQVGEASFSAFGGQLQAGNFETPLDRLEVKTLVLVTKVRLEEVSRLFPTLQVKVSGPVSGAVPIEWRDGRMHLGSGVLDLIPGELATVNLPADFDPLTAGKKSTEFGYGTLKKVERAILELHANRLHIETYPASAQGQTVLIRMVGAPAGHYITAPVHLNFNVYAPLTDLVDWSLKGDLSVEGVR